MRFTVSRDLTGAQLRGRLPPRLRDRVPRALQEDGSYTLIVFRGPEVVSSALVRNAMERLTERDRELVAAGPNFTAEARQLLGTQGALLVSAGDLHWTDESVATVR